MQNFQNSTDISIGVSEITYSQPSKIVLRNLFQYGKLLNKKTMHKSHYHILPSFVPFSVLLFNESCDDKGLVYPLTYTYNSVKQGVN